MKGDTLFKSAPHPHPNFAHLTKDGRRKVEFNARSAHHVKYYYIDFGLSNMFPSYGERKLVTGAEGRERNIPELSNPNQPYDPFKVDVCIVGRFIQRDFYLKVGGGWYFSILVLT